MSDGDVAPRSPHPAERAVEVGLALIIVALALGRWVASLGAPAEAPAAAPDTFERLGQLQDDGRGQLPAALVTLVALAALAALVHVLARAARAVRVSLAKGEPLTPARVLVVAAAWWKERTAGLERGLSVGHVLVAFGLLSIAGEVPVLLLAPRGSLRVEAPGEAPVDVVLALTGHGVAPVDTAVRATFFPGLGSVTARVEGGPVLVDGAPRGPGRVQLHAPAVVEVGATRVAVSPPAARGWLASMALGQAFGVLLLVGGALALGGRAGLGRLGLTARGLGREVRRGALAWLAALPVYFVVVALWASVAKALGIPPVGHALVEVLEREGAALAPIIVVQAALLAPLQEELLVRGLLLAALARVWGPAGGLAASALVFGFMHAGFLSLAPMVLLGALFGGLYATSPHRSLVGAMTAHALHNGVTLLLVISVQLA